MIAFASSYRVCTTIVHPPVKLGRGRHSGNMMLAKFLFVLFLFSAVADNTVHINCQGIFLSFVLKKLEVSNVSVMRCWDNFSQGTAPST